MIGPGIAAWTLVAGPLVGLAAIYLTLLAGALALWASWRGLRLILNF